MFKTHCQVAHTLSMLEESSYIEIMALNFLTYNIAKGE
jgi:hypothetical protein